MTYVDHGTPWRVVAPNMRVTLFRRPERNDYGGTAPSTAARSRSRATRVRRARCSRRSAWSPPNLHFDHINLMTDGAESVLVGDLQMNRWPEQIYTVSRRSTSRRRRASTSTRQNFAASGDRAVRRHVPLLQRRARAEGAVADAGRQRRARREHLALPEPARRRAVGSGPARGDERARAACTAAPRNSTTGSCRWTTSPVRGERSGTSSTDRSTSVELTDFLQTEGIRLAGRATGTQPARVAARRGGWDQLRGGG